VLFTCSLPSPYLPIPQVYLQFTISLLTKCHRFTCSFSIKSKVHHKDLFQTGWRALCTFTAIAMPTWITCIVNIIRLTTQKPTKRMEVQGDVVEVRSPLPHMLKKSILLWSTKSFKICSVRQDSPLHTFIHSSIYSTIISRPTIVPVTRPTIPPTIF
jgi:hypothetical protein